MVHYSLLSEVDFYTTTAQEGNMALHTGDDYNTVLTNRKSVCQTIGVSFDFLTCHQAVHGVFLEHVNELNIGKGHDHHEDAFVGCDAMYTKLKNVPLMVFHADCVPILFYDRKNQLVGAIHAGYQGIASGIIPIVFNQLIDDEGLDVDQTFVYIGPSIHQSSFELDKEKASKFDSSCVKEINGHFYVDLKAQILLQLKALNITQFLINDRCTYQDPMLYSYRQNKTIYRHGSIVVMR